MADSSTLAERITYLRHALALPRRETMSQTRFGEVIAEEDPEQDGEAFGSMDLTHRREG